jgi:hypothetical protein
MYQPMIEPFPKVQNQDPIFKTLPFPPQTKRPIPGTKALETSPNPILA